MKKISSLFVLLLFLSLTTLNAKENSVGGVVFMDSNNKGVLDSGENGIKGVCVSNGKDVVLTNAKGEWQLAVSDNFNVFVIKTTDYSVSLNKKFIPQHSFLKTSKQSSPESINSPLIPNTENKKFSVLLFGDTQARGTKEVDYIYRDVVDELIGTDAVFGISLGDNVADEPELMDEIIQEHIR